MNAQACSQLTLSVVLSVAATTAYALGEFTQAIAAACPAVAAIWPAATGFAVLLSAPVMVLSGLALSRATTAAARTRSSRTQSMFCVAGFALFTALCPLAVSLASPTLVYVAVAAVGVPLGILTLLTLEHMLVWLPARPGVAIALSSLSFNGGTVLLAGAFSRLQRVLDVKYALALSGASVTVMCVLYCAILVFPEDGWESSALEQSAAVGVRGCADSPDSFCEDESSEDDSDAEHGDGSYASKEADQKAPLQHEEDDDDCSQRLTWRTAAHNIPFWLFTACMLSVGANFALIPYFFRLGALYGAGSGVIDRAFQLGGLLGIPLAPAISAIAPSFRQEGRPLLSIGARNVTNVIFLLQIVACARLAVTASFVEFALLAALLRAFYMVLHCMASLLAREVFGKHNTAFVYGVGGGLALGSGEAASVGVMAGVEKAVGTLTSFRQVTPFYIVLGVWSAVTIVLMLFLRPECHREQVMKSLSDDERWERKAIDVV